MNKVPDIEPEVVITKDGTTIVPSMDSVRKLKKCCEDLKKENEDLIDYFKDVAVGYLFLIKKLKAEVKGEIPDITLEAEKFVEDLLVEETGCSYQEIIKEVDFGKIL